jgi:hypothetical protein
MPAVSRSSALQAACVTIIQNGRGRRMSTPMMATRIMATAMRSRRKARGLPQEGRKRLRRVFSGTTCSAGIDPERGRWAALLPAGRVPRRHLLGLRFCARWTLERAGGTQGWHSEPWLLGLVGTLERRGSGNGQAIVLQGSHTFTFLGGRAGP